MADQTLRFAEPGPAPSLPDELTYSPTTGLCVNDFAQIQTVKGFVRRWYAVDDLELLEAVRRYRARQDVIVLTVRRDGATRTYRRPYEDRSAQIRLDPAPRYA